MAPYTKTNGSAKRKRNEADERPVQKRAKAQITRPPAGSSKKAKVNHIPTQALDIYVMGEGGFGELGLGSEMTDGKKPRGVKRPRLNTKLDAKTVGVVQVACGGMHVVVLTNFNKILTWGVNDQGALGRDTTWEGPDSADDDVGFDLNPKESTPMPVDMSELDYAVTWTQVAASDSASFALTEDGQVYGWGTFRVSGQHKPSYTIKS